MYYLQIMLYYHYYVIQLNGLLHIVYLLHLESDQLMSVYLNLIFQEVVHIARIGYHHNHIQFQYYLKIMYDCPQLLLLLYNANQIRFLLYYH